MNSKTIVYLILASLLMTLFSCDKNTADIPSPKEAPPVVVEKPAEEVKPPPKPVVEEVEEPEEVPTVDLSKINMGDVYFDFDKSDLRDDAIDRLKSHVEILKANPEILVLIEGHCDERGTEEYNLALGERRATRVLDYFASSGIDGSRLKTISYGELRPKAEGSDEDAWSKNRRAHFKLSKK